MWRHTRKTCFGFWGSPEFDGGRSENPQCRRGVPERSGRKQFIEFFCKNIVQFCILPAARRDFYFGKLGKKKRHYIQAPERGLQRRAQGSGAKRFILPNFPDVYGKNVSPVSAPQLAWLRRLRKRTVRQLNDIVLQKLFCERDVDKTVLCPKTVLRSGGIPNSRAPRLEIAIAVVLYAGKIFSSVP